MVEPRSINHSATGAASTINDGHQEDAPSRGEKDTVPTDTNYNAGLLSGEYEPTAKSAGDKYGRSTPNRQSTLDALTFYSSPSDESSFPQKSDFSSVNRTRLTNKKEDLDHELGQRSHFKSRQEDDGANNIDMSKKLTEDATNNENGGTFKNGINKLTKNRNDTNGTGEPKTTTNDDSGSRKEKKGEEEENFSITTRKKAWTQEDRSPYFNKTVKIVKGKYTG